MATARIIGYELDLTLTKLGECQDTTMWKGTGFSTRIPEGEYDNDEVLVYEDHALEPLPVPATASVHNGKVEVMFNYTVEKR